MPDKKADLPEWCKDARKLLSKMESEGPKAMAQHTRAVAELLKLMEAQPLAYPGLAAFRSRYRVLATKAETAAAAASAKTMKTSVAKAEVKAASIGLLKLQQDMTMAMGAVDPTDTHARATMLEAARNEPVYRNKCERIARAIEELSPLPGTRKQVTALQMLIDTAKKMEPDFEAAYEQLEGLSGNLEEGRKAADKFEKGDVDPKLKVALTALRLAIGNYKDVAGVGDAAGVEADGLAITGALKAIDVASSPARAKAITDATVAFAKRALALQALCTAIDLDKTAVETLQSALSPAMIDIKTNAPTDIVSPLLQRFNAAQTLAASQQYKLARDALSALQAPLTLAQTTHKAHVKQWAEVDTKLELGRKTLDWVNAEPLARNDPVMSAVAGRLRTLIDMTLRAQMIPLHRYADALELVKSESVLANLAALEAKLVALSSGKPAPDPVFVGEETNLRVTLGKLTASVKAGQDKVRAAIAQLVQAKGDASSFQTALQGTESEWRDAGAVMTDDSFPLADRLRNQPMLQATAKKLLATLSALEAKMLATLSDPEKLKTSVASQEHAADAPAFDKARLAAKAGSGYLEEFGADPADAVMTATPSFSELKAQYEQLLVQAKTGDYAIAKMDKLATDFANKRGMMELALRQRREAGNARLALLTQQLATLRKSDKSHAAFFDTLGDGLAECTAMLGSTVLRLMGLGETRLTALELQFKAHATEFAKQGGANFATVEVARAAMEKELGGKDLKEYQPVLQARLKTEFDKVLPERLKLLAPEAALAALAAFQKQIDELKALASTASTNHANLSKQVASARTALEALKAKAPNLYASFKARIDAVAAKPKNEATNGKLEIEAVIMLIGDANEKPESREKLEHKLVRDQFEAERAKENFKAAVDVFKKDLLREAKEVYDGFSLMSSDRNDSLYKLIATRLKEAEDEGKSGDPTVALEKLRVAQATVRAFMDNPNVPAVASRKALLTSSAQWKVGVSGYLKALSDLKAAIAKGVDEHPAYDATVKAATKKNALATLDPLTTLFSAVTFESTATLLSQVAKAPGEVPARRAAKEHALMVLNRYQRILAEHQVLSQVRDNPFLAMSLTPMEAALNNLNGALLTS